MRHFAAEILAIKWNRQHDACILKYFPVLECCYEQLAKCMLGLTLAACPH